MCRLNLRAGLSSKRLEFFLVGFRVGGTHVPLQSGWAGVFLRFDKELEVGFDAGLIADFGEPKGVDMAGGGDEIEIAANTSLGRMHVQRLWAPLMIQNSLSPVVKSRISSFSGRTMSVEKRSLARTAITSFLLYLTT